jgi:hypothetical protein
VLADPLLSQAQLSGDGRHVGRREVGGGGELDAFGPCAARRSSGNRAGGSSSAVALEGIFLYRS